MSLSELQPRRMAHTLFMDFVGYSRLTADAQAAVRIALQDLVQVNPTFQEARASQNLMVRRTGDGMAVVFFDAIESPLKTAVSLDQAIRKQAVLLREQAGAPFRLRMGVHSGPVVILEENGEMDVAGEGINTAQRVMDCGDEGHILVSSVVANTVAELPDWQGLLHDLGVVRVKHDELVHLFNLHGMLADGSPVGFEAVPKRVHESRERARQLAERDQQIERVEQTQIVAGWALRTALVIAAVLVVGGALWGLWRYQATTDIKRLAGAVREARNARRNGNATPEPTVVTVPTPNTAHTGPTEATPKPTTIPSLSQLPRAEAEAKLQALGLKLALSERTPSVPHATIPKDAVVAQFPAAGGPLVVGTTIYVTLSSGSAEGSPTSPAYTGIVVDARNLTDYSPAAVSGLYSSTRTFLYNAVGSTADENQAMAVVGATPLRITPLGAGDEVGRLILSDTDVEQLRQLSDPVRARTVILHR